MSIENETNTSEIALLKENKEFSTFKLQKNRRHLLTCIWHWNKEGSATSPLSPTNFQIYKKWPSPVFCFSKSMVYWGYKINKTKKNFCQIFILWILEVCDVTEVKKVMKPKNSWKLRNHWMKQFEKGESENLLNFVFR